MPILSILYAVSIMRIVHVYVHVPTASVALVPIQHSDLTANGAEERSFWTFAALFERLLPTSFSSQSMEGDD